METQRKREGERTGNKRKRERKRERERERERDTEREREREREREIERESAYCQLCKDCPRVTFPSRKDKNMLQHLSILLSGQHRSSIHEHSLPNNLLYWRH